MLTNPKQNLINMLKTKIKQLEELKDIYPEYEEASATLVDESIALLTAIPKAPSKLNTENMEASKESTPKGTGKWNSTFM